MEATLPLLNQLEAVGLIRLQQEEPDLEYLFRHALTQEAAYTSLTRRHRQGLHQAIAEIVQGMYPDRQEDLADVLALHFGAAGLWEQAVPYVLLAARRALSTYAYAEGTLQLQRALDAVGPDGPAPLRLALHEALGDAFALTREGRQAIARYEEALAAWGQQSGADLTMASRLHRKIIQTSAEIKWAVDRGEFRALRKVAEASEDFLREAIGSSGDLPAHPETVRLLAVLSTAAWRMRLPPDWEAATRHAETAIRMADDLGNPVELSIALESLGNAHFGNGRLRDSVDVALRRLELARQPDFPDERQALDALRGAGSALTYVGEYSQAIPILLEALQIAQRVQSVDQIFNTMSLLTLCWLRLDRWDEIQAWDGVWEDFERRYPQERTGPVCWPQALRSIVHIQRGEVATGTKLRDRSFGIMVKLFGETTWFRNAHY